MLSIATISFNQSSFLREAMDSVVTQLEDSDQYIVIDGGSEDGSQEIIESFESRLHYWQSRRDRGPADALNQALEAASMPFFYYINADDYVLPGALIRLRQFLAATPIEGFAYGHGWTHSMTPERVTRRYSDRWDMLRYARGLCSVVQQSTVLSTNAMRSVGGFNAENRTCWDGELLFDLSRGGFPSQRLPFEIGAFRIHDESITGSASNATQYHQDRARIANSIDEEYRSFESRPLFERVLRRGTRFLHHASRRLMKGG